MGKMPARFVTTNDNQLSYDPETRTLAAGETQQLVTWCDWVEFLSVTSDTMQVSLNGAFFFPLALGLILRPAGGIRRLFIKNTSGVANTVQISKGLGNVEDRRVVISPTTLLNVNPQPTAYGARFWITSAAGSAFNSNTIVAAGSNINGIVLCSAHLSCGADPTAFARLNDSTNTFMESQDSQLAPLGAPITIPAGNSLVVATFGLCRCSGTYRIL